MAAAQPVGPGQRQTDAMDRQRVSLREPLQQGVWRPARPHVVLGMDLEEAARTRVRERVGAMLRLEGDARGGRLDRQRHRRIAPSGRWPGPLAGGPGPGGHAGRLISLSEPGPCGVCMVTQVPLGTSFQALP